MKYTNDEKMNVLRAHSDDGDGSALDTDLTFTRDENRS